MTHLNSGDRHSYCGGLETNLSPLYKNFRVENRKNEAYLDPAQHAPVDTTNDPSGMHVQNIPAGAGQLNESYSKPGNNLQGEGASSEHADTSGNEDNGSNA